MGEIVNMGTDGLIYVIYKQIMTDADIALYIKELKETVNSNFKNKIPNIILTDISAVEGQLTSAQRRTISDGIAPFKKMIKKSAVTGFNNPFKRAVMQIGVLMAGRSEIQLFDHREDAMSWLKK